jgi:hypothetical protein
MADKVSLIAIALGGTLALAGTQKNETGKAKLK